MSIKPVTYQGASNFRASLYALEVRSRFIDQNAADGYYKGYGNELNATVSSNVITIGSGALLVQGRLNEIESGGEAVPVTIQNGYVGYIIARIETYHPSDTENCRILARTGTSLSAITLTKEDTYQKGADSQNKVYELPLYSFSMSGGAITNLEKLISPIEENRHVKEIAERALSTIEAAYAKIDEMLEQSCVESANVAKSLTNTFKEYKTVNGYIESKELTIGRIYVISMPTKVDPDQMKTTVIMIRGTYMEMSSSCGYSVIYRKSTGIEFRDADGNLYKPETVYIREL